MKDTYFNSLYGGVMSAEEYAALLAAEGNTVDGVRETEGICSGGGGCPTAVPCLCRCQSIPCPCPIPQVDEGCCCKQSFRAAFQLLGDSVVSELLDFDQAAFITEDYVAGTTLEAAVGTVTPADNLVEPLAGSFRRLSPCSCDLLDITGLLYTPPATATGLTVTQVNLCELLAVAIDLADTVAEGDLTPEEVAARNFRLVRRSIARRLNPGCETAADCCACTCSEDCCCAAGLLDAMGGNSLNRRVTLAAGPLLLSGVSLLGTVGNVLVLANDTDQRIYFVCVNGVEFFT